ncbi:hypothetical protein [Leptospira santarosai]|uniref:Lipoprotein n=1 Tax=Leptospira santarosai serovar Shermani str. LT 821 TaxID=758847 RepID=K8Y354_9LEPT|nr:hypothetical protein [Leptospira santarosai]EKT85132.1 hypothetical protein LSS_19038 [Leptospira santarosai serovar Shermani str. LT 821]EPG83644.1 putative lipoprotein [Leptospira santarosai serovar Shermani str. 1342KT]
MKRFIAIFLIFSVLSCASYQSKVEKNKTDLDRVDRIVENSNDISKEDREFIQKTLTETKELLNTGVSESALADKWRDWIFDKWLFVCLFVLGIVGLIVWKLKSFSFPLSFRKNGGSENAG